MTHKMLVRSLLLTVGLTVGLAVAGVTAAQQFKLTSPDIKPNGVIAEEQVFKRSSMTIARPTALDELRLLVVVDKKPPAA